MAWLRLHGDTNPNCPSTFFTDYASGLASLFAALLLYFKRIRNVNDLRASRPFNGARVALSFSRIFGFIYMFVGSSYITAGIAHQYCLAEHQTGSVCYALYAIAIFLFCFYAPLQVVFVYVVRNSINPNLETLQYVRCDEIRNRRRNVLLLILLISYFSAIAYFAISNQGFSVRFTIAINVIIGVVLIAVCVYKMHQTHQMHRSLLLFIAAAVVQIATGILWTVLFDAKTTDFSALCTATCGANCIAHIGQCIGLLLNVPAILYTTLDRKANEADNHHQETDESSQPENEPFVH